MAQNQRVSCRTHRPIRHHGPEVHIENALSEQGASLDVVADDTQGLLHERANPVPDLGLSIQAAPIGTQLPHGVDGFHVTEQDRHPVEDG